MLIAVIKKPLFPALVHDDTIRLIILSSMLVVCLFITWRLLKKVL